ncbi:MAG TPA: DUF402 domain-containing protein, partial [Anaerolineaceae bacterium]
MPSLNVLKLDIHGKETWRYPARVIHEEPDRVIIEAHFNRDDLPFHGILLGRGDRFLETYFRGRMYNIFEIHAREDDRIRGWYCNITRLAEITPEAISYVDLALDLLVYPDGGQLVLDEDEFADLLLSVEEREQARQALVELQAG